MNILLVEDEPTLRSGLTDLLVGAGHKVEAVGDGLTACGIGLTSDVNLVLVDLTLPDLDGLEVCRRLRNGRPDLLIMMLTARTNEDDKVKGLQLGADDYVTKPFGAREVLARIEALARRSRPELTGPERIEVAGAILDLGRCECLRGDSNIRLTAREARILRVLFINRARAMSRGELLEQVWGASANLQTRTVDMTIANLRQKIE